MLANGATLAYSTDGTSFTTLPGLKEIPDMGVELEKVENTCLTDSHKMYELGIGDLPDTTYKFKYDNSSTDANYRKARELADGGDSITWKETDKDGTTYTFSGACSVKRTGAGVNGAVEFDLNIAIDSEIEVGDPA